MKKINFLEILSIAYLIFLSFSICWSGERKFEELKRFKAKEAQQGIAWDRTEPGVIYGLIKKERLVITSKLIIEK